ncbi:MAG: Threonine--tRNA ligase [Chlamydiales bacterium]|jgi:hypothetical protein|nr:Threonine--tRNA ligase [Chlamydiales bacterium]
MTHLSSTASCLVVKAVRQIFPRVEAGDVVAWREGFYVDLLVPKESLRYFDASFKPLMEEQLRSLLCQSIPLKSMTMTPVSAEALFLSQKNLVQGEVAARAHAPLISLLKMDEECLICPEPHVEVDLIDHIQVERVEPIERKACFYEERPSFVLFRLHGRAFASKFESKQHAKRQKVLEQVLHGQIGPSFFSPVETLSHSEVSLGVWGSALLRQLECYWRSSLSFQEEVETPSRGPFSSSSLLSVERMGFEGDASSLLANPLPHHLALLMQSKKPKGAYAEWRSSYFPKKLPFDDGLFDLCRYRFDVTTYFLPREDARDILISSLQFILKTISILGLRWRITAFKRQNSKKAPPSTADTLISDALSALQLEADWKEDEEWSFKEESSLLLRRNRSSRLEIEWIDSFERSWLGPFLQVEPLKAPKGSPARQFVVQTSLFPCAEKLMGVIVEDHLGRNSPLPFSIAPWQILLSASEKGKAGAEKLAQRLISLGYRVRFSGASTLASVHETLGALAHLSPFQLHVEGAFSETEDVGQLFLLKEGRPQKTTLDALFKALDAAKND